MPGLHWGRHGEHPADFIDGTVSPCAVVKRTDPTNSSGSEMWHPSFSRLPIDKHGPPLNAWGLYGQADERGRLNLITPEAVKRGRDEIKDGIVVHLEWVALQLGLPSLPLDTRPLIPSREGLKRQV